MIFNKKGLVLLAATTLFTLGACGSGNSTSSSKTSSSDSSTTSSSEEKIDVNSLDLPQLDEGVADDEYLVEIVTTDGSIQAKLFPEIAPKAVENFVTHAKEGYYDGVIFHRVIEDFMVQTGDPKGDGTGGESIWGEPFEDEPSHQLYNIRGALSMANSGENTNGSQFFIVQNSDDVSDGLLYDDYPKKIVDAYKNGGAPYLDGFIAGNSNVYTVFGQVTEGMDVVDKIAASATDDNDKPLEDIKIEKINILQEPK